MCKKQLICPYGDGARDNVVPPFLACNSCYTPVHGVFVIIIDANVHHGESMSPCCLINVFSFLTETNLYSYERNSTVNENNSIVMIWKQNINLSEQDLCNVLRQCKTWLYEIM